MGVYYTNYRGKGASFCFAPFIPFPLFPLYNYFLNNILIVFPKNYKKEVYYHKEINKKLLVIQ